MKLYFLENLLTTITEVNFIDGILNKIVDIEKIIVSVILHEICTHWMKAAHLYNARLSYPTSLTSSYFTLIHPHITYSTSLYLYITLYLTSPYSTSLYFYITLHLMTITSPYSTSLPSHRHSSTLTSPFLYPHITPLTLTSPSTSTLTSPFYAHITLSLPSHHTKHYHIILILYTFSCALLCIIYYYYYPALGALNIFIY